MWTSFMNDPNGNPISQSKKSKYHRSSCNSIQFFLFTLETKMWFLTEISYLEYIHLCGFIKY